MTRDRVFNWVLTGVSVACLAFLVWRVVYSPPSVPPADRAATELPAQLREAASSQDGVPVVKTGELRLLLKDPDTVVVDIRERSLFYVAHLPNALNMPIDEIIPRAPHELPDDREILVYCPASLSKGALAALRYVGFTKVRIIADDLAALARAGIRVDGKPGR